MNRPPSLLTRLLNWLGAPAFWLLRRLGYRPTAPVILPETPADTSHEPTELLLPPGWTRPREMAEAKPTLAPVLLAFGLAGAALGMLITTWSIVVLGVLLALLGGGMWAWDSFDATRPGEGE
ncbi:hypothetical protein [Deinococcus sp.]|uniref:hypothetical protein n=1 Tax=Deinococcus sp. TaxID=47478 RepID=UPI003B5CA114